jgi:hypothetical protein
MDRPHATRDMLTRGPLSGRRFVRAPVLCILCLDFQHDAQSYYTDPHRCHRDEQVYANPVHEGHVFP